MNRASIDRVLSLRIANLRAIAFACVLLPGPSIVTAPAGEDASRSRGGRLFEQHDFSASKAAFQAVLDENPNDPEALTYLGRIAFEQNQLDEAVRYFERAATAAPRSSVVAHWLGRAYGVQARDLGVPRGVGPARRARKALEKAVQFDPNNLEARVDLATFYREAPGIVGGSKRAALTQVEETLKRDPYLGALIRGDLALDDNKLDEAERQYRRAAERDPSKTEAYLRLGVLYQRAERFDEAFAMFEKVLAMDAKDKRSLFQIGKTADLSHQRLDRGEEALKSYLQCQPFYIMPKLTWAHRRLGNIYLHQGHPGEARQQYLAALKLAPEDKEAAAALKRLDASSVQIEPK